MRVKLGSFFFRYRNVLGPAVFLFALLVGRPSYPLGRPETNLLIDLAGIGIALSGQVLRILTIGYEYIERGGRNRQVYASSLVQGGVFAHCRNPLYVGNLLIAIGFSLVIHSLAFYLLVLPVVAYGYVSIVAAEEAFLRAKFKDEYMQYCQRVNRWLPSWRGWRASIAGMRFSWQRVLVKEYNTVFVMVPALAGVKLWSDYQVLGAAALPPQPGFLFGLATWLAAYLLVRTLKKRGYVKA
ncbi:MAG TPA: isoprenylcysteine carboxylmethyltransferase family protein [Telluria sp.]